MKATYLKSINPIIVDNNPTKKMISLADSLIGSENVETFRVIQYFSYPKLKDFDISLHSGKSFTDVINKEFPTLLKKLDQYPDCNLSGGKVASFMDFIMLMSCFGAIINTDKLPVVNTPEYQYIYGREKAIEFLRKYPSDEVGILVFKFKTSRSKINDWLNDSWSYIKKLNQKLPKNNLDGKLSADKSTNIPKNIAKDLLIYLCKQSKLSYSKTATKCYEIFPDDPGLADVDQIKSRYSRFKKYISKSEKASELMRSR